MTPDWAARPTAVPYAVFGDPQSLNLYGYVRNDPVSSADADGHESETQPCVTNTAGCDSSKKGTQGQTQNASTNGKTIGKGIGEVGGGVLVIGVAIVAAPETGGGSLAALALAGGIMGGTGAVGVGIVDIAHGSGVVDSKTAEDAAQGINIATNPVAANALMVTNPNNAENIGNVANGVIGARDLAKRPEGIADAVSKLSSAKDVREGYKSAKELIHQVGSYLQDKATSLYQYF